MSVGSVGASSSAYSYLQSILQQQSTSGTDAGDPVSTLLNAFYPTGAAPPGEVTSAADPGASTGSSPPPPPFSPDTMSTLLSVQAQQSGPQGGIGAQAQTLFGEFDADGNGQISQTEFENAFGSGADMSKVDGLFNALDANGDGSVSQDELTSAAQQAQQAQGQHHHHHHAHGAGGGGGQGGGGGGLSDLLSGTDATGATSETSSNDDGSSTTTISYADGSKVSMTTPAAASSGSQDASNNLIEQLIKLQSQMLTQSAGSISASVGSSVAATI